MEAIQMNSAGNGANGNGGNEWLNTEDAAPRLHMSVRVLRDMLTRHARKVGSRYEAHFDGIVGHKVGRRWKVCFSDYWTDPHRPRCGTVAVADSTCAGGKEKTHAGTH